MAPKVNVAATVDPTRYTYSGDLLEDEVYVPDGTGGTRFVCPGDGRRIWKKRTCTGTEQIPVTRELPSGGQGVIGCICHNCGLLVIDSISPLCEIYIPKGKKMFRLPALEM
ncbi:MAG: hypothetical protein HGA67_01430 [Candidatus Yonathbacteria bacterium]|nr:hypothetical protein [Candidatus Yonathbacteria bacterium]